MALSPRSPRVRSSTTNWILLHTRRLCEAFRPARLRMMTLTLLAFESVKLIFTPFWS